MDSSKKLILGIDPGREKTGLALVRGDEVVWRKIIAPADLETEIRALLQEHAIEKMALGHSTSSQNARQILETADFGREIPVQIVPETGSTLEARALYFAHNPPRGWRRIVPLSLQTPPENVDDFAAVVIARRADGEGH